MRMTKVWAETQSEQMLVEKTAPTDLLHAGLPQTFNLYKMKHLWSVIRWSPIKWSMPVINWSIGSFLSSGSFAFFIPSFSSLLLARNGCLIKVNVISVYSPNLNHTLKHPLLHLHQHSGKKMDHDGGGVGWKLILSFKWKPFKMSFNSKLLPRFTVETCL